MEGLAKYRSSPLCRSVYIAARIAGYGRARCSTMCTAVLVHKSEKHSFPVTPIYVGQLARSPPKPEEGPSCDVSVGARRRVLAP